MNKTIVGKTRASSAPAAGGWLDLSRLAAVELTSEDPAHPIEAALKQPPQPAGWRAGTTGRQMITLQFIVPQDLRQIYLRFEHQDTRTQEFQLTCRCVGDSSSREIVRQQYNFAPGGTTLEEETYNVDLKGVSQLTLTITPDLSGGSAYAALQELRLR
jgi:hypothetical protein